MIENTSLFDDLDFDDLVVPSGPKKKEEPKTATKEEITEAVKDVVNEIKPLMAKNLEDLFNLPEEEEEGLDNEDFLKKTTTEKLKSTSEILIDDIKVFIKEEDGEYALYKSVKEAEGERIVEGTLTYEKAVEKGVDYILKATSKGKKKKSFDSKTASKKTPVKPKVEEPYEGSRVIKVWGRELWTETDPKVTENEIVEKIGRDFGLPEFKEGKVIFDLDREAGILNVGLSFNKKG